MVVFTYSEARQKLSAVLEQAAKDGEVRIRRRDGQMFVIRPEKSCGSPLDVGGVDLDVSTGEILEFIQEGRRDV